MKFLACLQLISVVGSIEASSHDYSTPEGLDDIPTTIKKIDFFTTLVAALGATDLVPALSGAGPFTVFAPVDDAFAALPAALVPCLLLPKNKAVLTAILSYHVVDGGLAAYNLVDTQVIPTWLEGQDVTAKRLDDGTVRINKAHLILEILTTNGVVHAIDAVLVPPSVDVTAFLATCPAVDADASADTDDSGSSVATATTVTATIGAAVVAALL